jgi:exonuclease III
MNYRSRWPLLLLIFLSMHPAISMETEPEDAGKITVLQWNVGTYGDGRGLRPPKNILESKGVTILDPEEEKRYWKSIDEERNKILDIYLAKIAALAPDIFTLQEAHGLYEKEEKKGIRPLLKKHFGKKYKFVEAAAEKSLTKTTGTAIIYYKKDKFKELGAQSSPKAAYAFLQDMRGREILAASAFISGFELAGPDSGSITGDGRAELKDVIDFMSNEKFAKAIKIVGMDANSPPFGQIYKKGNVNVTISSTRISQLAHAGFITGCPINGVDMPSPTAKNHICEEGVRLDYVLVGNSIDNAYKITVKENTEIAKSLASYELKKRSLEEIPITAKKAKPDERLPPSDHLPVYAEIDIE